MWMSKLRLALAVAAMAALPLAGASAQGTADQKTFFTFSAPVELPGMTLPAGTYTFRVIENPSNRHIVQVLSEDGMKLHTTLFTIPAERMEPSDEPEVRFMETRADTPAALKMWYYPGRTIGHEFIWPREQALQLAARSTDNVLTTRSDVVVGEGLPDEELSRVDAAGADVDVAEVTVVEETRTAEVPAPVTEPTITEPAPAPVYETRETTTTTRTRLPRTAGVLPLVGLIGVGSLVAGAGVRRLRRRR